MTALLDRVAGAIERHRAIRAACVAAGFNDADIIGPYLESPMDADAVRQHVALAAAAIARRRAGKPAPSTTVH